MFHGSPASLLLGVVFSALGLGYVAYGKRAADLPLLIAGFVLILFPLFVGSVWLLLLIGGAAALAPWAGSRMGWW